MGYIGSWYDCEMVDYNDWECCCDKVNDSGDQVLHEEELDFRIQTNLPQNGL